jgi:hypothetical protein
VVGSPARTLCLTASEAPGVIPLAPPIPRGDNTMTISSNGQLADVVEA